MTKKEIVEAIIKAMGDNRTAPQPIRDPAVESALNEIFDVKGNVISFEKVVEHYTRQTEFIEKNRNT